VRVQHFTHFQNVNREPERSEGSVARTTRSNSTTRLPSAGPEVRVLLGATVRPDCPAPDQRSSALSPELATLKFDCFPAPQFICFCPLTHLPIRLLTCFFFFFPLLVAASIAASGCRFAKQNHCAVQYCQPIGDVECTGELKLVFHCSLFTAHCSLFTVSRVSKRSQTGLQGSTKITERNTGFRWEHYWQQNL